MACSLKNTTHAADQNRNYTNFSRVYGPKNRWIGNERLILRISDRGI